MKLPNAFLILGLVTAAAGQTAAPVVSASINGSQIIEVHRGWPMILTVSLMDLRLLDSDDRPVTVPDTSVFQVRVRPAGESATWRFETADLREPVSLTVGDLRYLQWYLSPEESASIPAGEYKVYVVLDTSSSELDSAWKGKAAARPISVRVTDEPADLSRADKIAKAQTFAEWQRLRGNPGAGTALVDDVLREFSDELSLLGTRAELLALAGNLTEALQTAEKIIDVQIRTTGPGMRIGDLGHLRRGIWDRLYGYH